VIERLAHDLRAAFPDMNGFSSRNLQYMRAFAEAWPDAEFVQEAVAQLPWGHNLMLPNKAEFITAFVAVVRTINQIRTNPKWA